MPSCRLLPHGVYTLFPAVLSTMAWLASLSQDGCDYSRLTGPIVQEVTGSADLPYIELGFVAYREPKWDTDSKSWKVITSGQCLPYDPDIEDSYWIAAKGLAFGALVLGGASALFLWFSSCFVFSPGTWRWAGYQVFFAFLCQTIAFMWFRTGICRADGNECSLFYGSKADIAAAVFWATSALLIFVRYPRPEPKFDPTNTSMPTIEVAEMNTVPVEGDPTASMSAPASTRTPNDTGGVIGQRIPDNDII